MSRPELDLGRPFDEASDPCFVLDPLDDRFVTANAAGCSLLGLPLGELLQTQVSAIHPGELHQLGEVVGRVLRTGHSTTIVLTCRTRAGSCVPVEMSLTRIDRGDRAYVLGLVRDRSDHRHRP